MNHIKTYFKEGTDGARAEVFLEEGVYCIRYYMGIGDTENWALGIKVLNG